MHASHFQYTYERLHVGQTEKRLFDSCVPVQISCGRPGKSLLDSRLSVWCLRCLCARGSRVCARVWCSCVLDVCVCVLQRPLRPALLQRFCCQTHLDALRTLLRFKVGLFKSFHHVILADLLYLGATENTSRLGIL